MGLQPIINPDKNPTRTPQVAINNPDKNPTTSRQEPDKNPTKTLQQPNPNTATTQPQFTKNRTNKPRQTNFHHPKQSPATRCHCIECKRMCGICLSLSFLYYPNKPTPQQQQLTICAPNLHGYDRRGVGSILCRVYYRNSLR